MDPEFLAALPEELQQEVLESRRREIQQRRNAREREEAQRVGEWPRPPGLVTSQSCLGLQSHTTVMKLRISKTRKRSLKELCLEGS